MASRERQGGQRGGNTQNEYSRKRAQVEAVLGDPSLYPDEFKSWIPRSLFGNVNFEVTSGQLPTIETHHLVGASGEVAFGGTWANFGGTNEPARYWKDYTGLVHLGGQVKLGVIGTTIFTLPAGYRPQYAIIVGVSSNNLFGVCTINPDGTVVATAGSNVYFSLSNISFRQYA